MSRVAQTAATPCVVCGRLIEPRPGRPLRKTCSRECHSKLIGLSNTRRGLKRSPTHIEKMKAGVAASPLAGPYETHSGAKDWHLVDPSGTEHRFRNLSLFIRSHAELFDPDDILPRGLNGTGPCRAATGLSNIRPDRKKRVERWKGWHWCGPIPPQPTRPIRAKPWALRAPGGTEFYFADFSKFVAEQAGCFTPEDLAQYGSKPGLSRARLCLGALRPSPNRRHKSWRGWTWIESPAAAS